MKISIAHLALVAIVCLGYLSLSLAEEVIGATGLPVVDHRALPVATEHALENKDEVPWPKAGGILEALYSQFMAASRAEPTEPSPIPGAEDEPIIAEPNLIEFLKVDLQEGRVAIEIITTGEGDILQGVIEELSSYGFELTATYHHTACGTIPIAAIPDMCTCESLIFARPVISKANIGSGSVVSEGVFSLQADLLQSPPYNLSGAGLTVGVLSDSYNILGGAAADISTGDLPGMPPPRILMEGNIDGIDEGRAMMQLIYDVAPGVNLAFHTAIGGQSVFASGIQALAVFGCDVIVDDIRDPFEPFFQDGIVAQAINEVAAMGIPYFSSAGNSDRMAYFSTFNSTGSEETIDGFVYTSFHDFGGGNQYQQFNASTGENAMVLQWDEPYASASPGGVPGASKDVDIFVYNATGSLVGAAADFNIGGDPTEFLVFSSPSAQTYLIRIGVRNESLPPGYIKLLAWDGVDFSSFQNAGASFGHQLAAGGAGVGAALWLETPVYSVNPPVIESFSSAGGNPFFFDVNGNRLTMPEVRNQPRFTGPDGGQTTFFGEAFEGKVYFVGTSASAPHVAAVAALLLEFNNTLTPDGIYKLLEDTAVDMDDPFTEGFDVGFDFKTGYGLVNASNALVTLLSTPPPMSVCVMDGDPCLDGYECVCECI